MGTEPCTHCEYGSWQLKECPKDYVSELTTPINLAVLATEGKLPVAGGTLDQSAWFMALWSRLEREQNQLLSEG